MSPMTQEWLEKAEGDFATAERESNVLTNPNYDATCFHAQQCIEKYLKARLQEANIPFGKTHDLLLLLDMILPVEPDWDTMRADLQALYAFAVAFRYPGDSAGITEAQEAMLKCRNIRLIIRQSLSL